jgi:two-component sensor histidine kinase
MSITERAIGYQFPARGSMEPDARAQRKNDALAAELQDALGREQVLLMEKQELSQRQAMLAEEFEHRVMNSLQLISSLLSLQSKTASSPEEASQLRIASLRVSALGRVHHRLHHLDHQKTVEFGQYLKNLCEDLKELLFEKKDGFSLACESMKAEIPTEFAIPLGFLINELVTNAAKYAAGNIDVRFKNIASGRYSLSVSDDGPGLPRDFDPGKSKGRGMNIVHALVKQIGGEFCFSSGENGHGTTVTVIFSSDGAAAHGT